MAQITEQPKPTIVVSHGATLADSSAAIETYSKQAGSPTVAFFIVGEPYLKGEEYPSLVNVWDNEDDAIFDSL